MARRRKQSTALFEVINASRREQKPLAISSRAGGRWWFSRPSQPKTAKAIASPASTDPNDPTANVTAASLMASRTPAAAAMSQPASVQTPAHAVTPPQVMAEPIVAEPVASASPSSMAAPEIIEFKPTSAAAASAIALLARSGMQVGLDHDHQTFTLRMRYTTALVTAFTILVVIGLAFAFGRRSGGGADSAKATVATAKKAPGRSSVLDPSKRIVARAADPFAPAAGFGPSTPQKATEPPMYVEAPVVDGIAQRTTNLNYLMIQRYPPEMQKEAFEVADFLTIHDIPCTVERSDRLPATTTTKGWYAVIGTRGFAPRFGRSADYEAYLKSIETVAKKLPARSKFGRLQPLAFKWAE